MADSFKANVVMEALWRVLEQANERVVITDNLGIIEYVNPAFERITGYLRSEAIGKSPSIVKSGHHSRDFYKTLWEELRRGRTIQARFINKKKNGTIYYEEQTITPIRNGAGDVTHFVSTARDLTVERELKSMIDQSEKLLGRWDSHEAEFRERVGVLQNEVNQLLKQQGKPPKYS